MDTEVESMQDNLETQLLDKKAELAELRRARSDANCSSKFSSAIDVERETRVEELEEEISKMEKFSILARYYHKGLIDNAEIHQVGFHWGLLFFDYHKNNKNDMAHPG